MTKTIKNLYVSLGRYRALYLLSALELILIISWIYSNNRFAFADTPTYYSAYDNITSGNIDGVRTPLYPLVIGIFKSIFGLDISKGIVLAFQGAVFLFSINWFGKTLENIIPYRRIGYLFTAIYALYPGMLVYCGHLMTESLSISLTTAEIYLISEAYYRNSYKKGIMAGLLCLLLWTLRPSFMPVVMILLVFWIWLSAFKGKEFRKMAVCGFCATLLSVAGIGIYAMMYYKAFNKVGLTCVSIWNNYNTIRLAGVIDTNLIENPDIKAAVDSIIDFNSDVPVQISQRIKEVDQLHQTLEICKFDKFVNQQVRHHPSEILGYLYRDRLEIILNSTCMCPGEEGDLPFRITSLTRIIRIDNGTAFLIFLASLCVLLYTDIKKRRVSYFIWLLCAIFAVNYLTIWIGAMAEFPRLIAPNYPVLLAISCWLMNMLVCFAADYKRE